MINLVMVLHCHQPVGNFDHVFKMAMEKCYHPLLDLLNTHPLVRAGLHFSGPLLEWIERNRPESLEMIAAMTERKQVEMLSGGFFEPLLATIPVRDAKGQVRMMNHYLSRRFKSNPTGFWLAERVWDPALPLILEDTGMTYTVVDDTHFYYAGLRPHEIYGIYRTEKEGHTLSLLATPMEMRYLIPFKPVEEVIDHLKAQDDMGHDLAVYGDDGEKFGLWPGTYEWVIEKGWLARFFSEIENNRDWLRTMLPGDYISSRVPLGRLYLPQASYEEMTEWALPPERARSLEDIIKTLKQDNRWEEWRPFVRGGIWDNFLVKYDESNRMHKKMIFLSERLDPDEKARDFLWRAQCNCAYWHGVFGGLYLGHLRRAVHENLIRAHEGMIDGSGEDIRLLHHDIDKDGLEEILAWSRELSLGIAPAKGGGIFELCHFKSGINLCDILTRRLEAYHYGIRDVEKSDPSEKERISSIHDLAQSGGEDLEKLLVFDNYTRISLLDHFLGPDATPQGYAVNDFPEEAGFIQGQYQVKKSEVTSEEAVIELYRKGLIHESPLFLTKSIHLIRGARINIHYGFENQGAVNISTRHGCEFNLNLYSDQDPNRYYFSPESGSRMEVSETGGVNGITRFELINRSDGLNVSFVLSEPASVWFFPIMTVSKSEEGFDYTYQGTGLLFLLPLDLLPGKRKALQIRIEFTYQGA